MTEIIEEKLAVVMIVKNEEELLERAVASAQNMADHITIVDTGSTDKTPEILRSLADRSPTTHISVGEYEWADHFAEARNFAINRFKTTPNWVVILDADEALMAGWAPALRKAIRQNPDALSFRFKCFAKNNPAKHHFMVRAFRRDKVQYAGRVHEAPTSDSGIVASGASLVYGSSPSHEHDTDRNIRLLRAEELEQLRENGRADDRTLFYIGMWFYERGCFRAALPYFIRRSASIGAHRAECAFSHYLKGKCLFQEGHSEEGRRAMMDAITLDPCMKAPLLAMADWALVSDRPGWLALAAVADDSNTLFKGL